MRTSRTNEEFHAQLAELIKRDGIASRSVGEIAAELRCSRRRLYEVAETKEGLLLAVARQQFAQSLAAGESAAAADSDPARSLVAYLGSGLRSAETLSAAFLEDLQRSEAGRALFDDYQLARSAGSRKILAAGVRCGEFKPMNFDVVVEVLLGAAFRLRSAVFLKQSGLTMTEAFEQAYNLVLRGLLVEAASPKDGPTSRKQSSPGR